MIEYLFEGWDDVARTLVIGTLGYVAMVVMLRLSGLRTLAKMNAFDFVVTVALGSALATILLDSGLALASGAAGILLLVCLQLAVTWISVRVPWWKRLVTGEPRLLLRDGRPLDGALRRTRVTRNELRSAARGAGFGSFGDIGAIVLETDGSFSIIADAGSGAAIGEDSTMEGVVGFGGDRGRDGTAA